MKLFSQDLIEKIVLDILVDLSKQEGMPKEVASQSIDVLNDSLDNIVFSGIIVTKIRPTVFSEEEEATRRTLIELLQLGFDCITENNDGSLELDKPLMNQFEYENIKVLIKNTKMEYAISQFINAFHQYERLESKYPELMKCM